MNIATILANSRIQELIDRVGLGNAILICVAAAIASRFVPEDVLNRIKESIAAFRKRREQDPPVEAATSASGEAIRRGADDPPPSGIAAYLHELESAAPGAPADFLLEQARSGSTLYEIRGNWLMKLRNLKEL